MTKQYSTGWLLTAKILQEAMHFTLPQPGPNHSKFNPKMQDFKRVLDSNCKTEQLNFFNWLSNGAEYVQNVIQWYKASERKFSKG